MNKAEFIEKLKQNMPEGLNKIETAKYIYVELGKEKAFDEKYFLEIIKQEDKYINQQSKQIIIQIQQQKTKTLYVFHLHIYIEIF